MRNSMSVDDQYQQAAVILRDFHNAPSSSTLLHVIYENAATAAPDKVEETAYRGMQKSHTVSCLTAMVEEEEDEEEPKRDAENLPGDDELSAWGNHFDYFDAGVLPRSHKPALVVASTASRRRVVAKASKKSFCRSWRK